MVRCDRAKMGRGPIKGAFRILVAYQKTGGSVILKGEIMRRPLCVAALVYTISVWILLQFMPWEPETYPDWNKKSVWAEGVVVSREYQTNENGEVKLLVELQDPLISETSGKAGGKEDPGEMDADAADKKSLHLPRKLLCRMGDGSTENAKELDERLPIGSRITVTGKFRIFRQASNAGEFDSRLYYRILGCEAQLTGAGLQAAEPPERSLSPGSLRFGTEELLHRARRRMSAVLTECLPGQSAEIMKAMLLGEKGGLDPELKELYQGAGIVHILAISGLHILMIGMGVFRLLRKLRAGNGTAAVSAMAVILLYGQMTGMSASSRRAAMMFLLRMLAKLAHRTYDLLTAVSIAGVLLLIREPLLLRYSGFLFSFGAVLGIALLMPSYETRPMKGLSVSLAVLPVHLTGYGTFPILSIALNLLVIPLMSAVMAGGFLTLALGLVSPVLGKVAGAVPAGILVFYEILCKTAQNVPGQEMVLGAPSGVQTAVYLGILALTASLKEGAKLWKPLGTLCGKMRKKAGKFRKKTKSFSGAADKNLQTGSELFSRTECEKIQRGRKSRPQEADEKTPEEAAKQRIWRREGLRIALTAAALLVLLIRIRPGFSLHAVDVGQGDGILIQADGVNIWMDGGSTDKQDVAEYQILPLLHYYGVRRLDCCILTHEDEDHRNGLEELLQNEGENGAVEIGLLLLPSVRAEEKTDGYRKMEELASEHGVPVRYLKEGDLLERGKLRMECLHPEENSGYAEANERSVTLYLTYGDFSCLLNGDLEGAGEERLLQYVRTERQKKEQTENMVAGTAKEGRMAEPDGRTEESAVTEAEERVEEEAGMEENAETKIPVTLLHVAHHGSRGATSEDFLQTFRPVYAYVSCGEDNRYGHPHQETLERLQEAGVQRIYDTRYGGELTFTTDGKRLRVRTFKGKQ